MRSTARTRLAEVDLGERHQEIARLAYALWESRGRPFGSAGHDWYQAEQQINSE